jgi:predicted AAA+ superfamily ATPase
MQKYLPVWFPLKEVKSELNTTISSLAPKILTKKEDLEKVQTYLDKLKDTLNAKGINNIALTGGYGSGKSSLLKTFQHWNSDDFNFLNISLAAFNQTKIK